jgi:hypothetical protein
MCRRERDTDLRVQLDDCRRRNRELEFLNRFLELAIRTCGSVCGPYSCQLHEGHDGSHMRVDPVSLTLNRWG